MTVVSPVELVPFAKVAEAPVRSIGRGWRRAGRTVVKKRGVLAPLLFPIGIAAGLVVVGVPSIAIWNIYSASEARRALHEAPVVRDDSLAKTSIKREVASDESEFVLRLVEGLSTAETADSLGINADAVKTRLSRAKRLT